MSHDQVDVEWAVGALNAQREWGEAEASRWMRFAAFAVGALVVVSVCLGGVVLYVLQG